MKVCSCCKRIYATEKDYMRNTTRWRMADNGDLYFNCSCKSTLVIPKGKHDWYNPRLFMSEQAQTVFNRFSDRASFPLLSNVALEAQRLVNDPDSDLAKISECIKLDPMISIWVLELADCARPKASAPIKTLNQALGILGREKLSEIITVSALSKFSMKTKKFGSIEYFRSAMLTGLIAQDLAREHLQDESNDYAYVAGSLCNVGRLLGSIVCPEEVDAVFGLTQNLSPSYTWNRAEAQLKATSSATLGEIACALWGVPAEVIDCVSNHNRVPDFSKKNLGNLEIGLRTVVALANEYCVHVLGQSHLSEPAIKEGCLILYKSTSQIFESKVTDYKSRLLQHLEKSTLKLFSTSQKAS